MKPTPEQIKQLEKAYGLISDVQIEMLKVDEDQTEDWRGLFTLRVGLNQYIYRYKQ